MNKLMTLTAAALAATTAQAADIYVSLEDALKLFGAMDGKGAQAIK